MIITFSFTEELSALRNKPNPLYTGTKTVTRRKWTNHTARNWIKHWERVHKVYNKLPFVRDSKQIGWIELLQPPYQEQLLNMPREDLFHEGNLWNSFEDFYNSIDSKKEEFVWVVRFKFMNLESFKQ